MKEAVICVVFYIGTLSLMSFKEKETPEVPPSTVCTEKHETKGPVRESPEPSSVDCSPKPAAKPTSKPRIEK